MTKKKTIYDRLFDIFFIAYVTCVFCFNDRLGANRTIYIFMFGASGMAFLSIIGQGTKLGVKTELMMLLLYLTYGYLVSMKAVYSVPLALERARTVALCIIPSVIICHYFIQRNDNNVFPIAIAIAGVVLSAYVIVHYGGLSSFYHQAVKEGERLGGEVGQTNSVGIYAAYTVITLFYFMLKSRRFYLGMFAVLPFIVAMASGSRKALFAIVIGVVIITFLSGNKKGYAPAKLFRFVTVSIILVLLAVFVSQLPIMKTILERTERMFDLFKTGKGESSATVRNKMIQAGIKAFPEHSLWGIGFNNASFINARYTGRFVYLHNDYIEQLVNLGICGVLLYYGNLANILRKHIRVLRNGNKDVILSFTILCIFLINAVGNVGYYSKITYMFFAYWISCIYITRSENND